MKALREMLLVIGVAVLGAAATWKISGPPSREIPCDPAQISAEEICLSTLLAEWPEGSFLWVDARPVEEWRKDGMPGSICLTPVGGAAFHEQVEAALESLATAPRAVVYCGSVGCGLSKDVARQLRELGLISGEIKALHGGMDALRQAGLLKGSSPSN